MSGRGIQVQGAITVEQFLHRHGVIHPGAVPWENAGLGIDIQTVLAVQGFDIGVAKRLRGVFRRASACAAASRSRRRTVMASPAAARASRTMAPVSFEKSRFWKINWPVGSSVFRRMVPVLENENEE
jgi:hypothetical protein